MEDEYQKLWEAVRDSSGHDRVLAFISMCERLVELKEKGMLSEEEAAYKIVGAMRHDDLHGIPEIEEIFDTAGDAEMPRTVSYKQEVGAWDPVVADRIKREEWGLLVDAIKAARARYA